MKNIFTLIVLSLSTLTIASAQTGKIRVVPVNANRIAVEIQFGPSADLPTSADPCDQDDINDILFYDINFTLTWTDPAITSLSVVDEPIDAACSGVFGDPVPTYNDQACNCWTVMVAGICDSVPLVGQGYGITDVGLTEGEDGGTYWKNFGAYDSDCSSNNYFPAPVDWEADTYYKIAEFEAIMMNPPGGDPLDLIDMISLDDGTFGPFVPSATLNTGLTDPINLTVDTDPLPLSLISFDANKEGERSAKLQWTTANEINTKVFVVERSNDRENWFDVAGIEAAGNSSGILEYSFIDKNVYDGRSERQTYYYRLRMVDEDDAFTYSNIDVVSFSISSEPQDGFKLFVFPNPAKDGFNVEINQASDQNPITRLELFDITGRIVYSRDIDSASLIEYVDFSSYNVTAGTYVLKASDAEGNLKTHEKIIVTR